MCQAGVFVVQGEETKRKKKGGGGGGGRRKKGGGGGVRASMFRRQCLGASDYVMTDRIIFLNTI